LSYHSALLELIIFFIAVYAIVRLAGWWDTRQTLSKIRSTPPPKRFEHYLEKTPHFPLLDTEDRALALERVRLFLAQKEFIGIRKEATEEMQVVIAFYAVLIALRFPEDCYHELKTVLIYPYRFVADEVSSYGGIYTKEEIIMDGQSSGDTVVISWHEARHEAHTLGHHNVIIHEFAHELDFEDGAADGIPPLDAEHYAGWSHVLFHHYDRLNEIAQKNRDWGDYALFGSYAATHPAEFFAVASEIFFCHPNSLHHAFPDVYAQLKGFYRIDTLKLLAKEPYR